MSAQSYLIMGGSILAMILAVVDFVLAVRKKSFYGTDSHRIRDLSGLIHNQAVSEPNFGTESHPIQDLSELTPTEAVRTENSL